MENKIITAHVVPARERVQSGKVIDGVKFRYSVDGYHRIIMDGQSDDFNLVLSSFKEVIRIGDEYLTMLDPDNVRDGVAIVEHTDFNPYDSLEDLLGDYLGDFNIYIVRSRHFPEILPKRDFFKGLDFYAYLYAYIHSGTVLYIRECHNYYLQHEAWDSGRIGYIFANKKKFKNDQSLFYNRIREALEEVNEFINGSVYNIIDNSGSYVATGNFVRNVLRKEKMLIVAE